TALADIRAVAPRVPRRSPFRVPLRSLGGVGFLFHRQERHVAVLAAAFLHLGKRHAHVLGGLYENEPLGGAAATTAGLEPLTEIGAVPRFGRRLLSIRSASRPIV